MKPPGAAGLGPDEGRDGVVMLIQRFGSAANLDRTAVGPCAGRKVPTPRDSQPHETAPCQ